MLARLGAWYQAVGLVIHLHVKALRTTEDAHCAPLLTSKHSPENIFTLGVNCETWQRSATETLTLSCRLVTPVSFSITWMGSAGRVALVPTHWRPERQPEHCHPVARRLNCNFILSTNKLADNTDKMPRSFKISWQYLPRQTYIVEHIQPNNSPFTTTKNVFCRHARGRLTFDTWLQQFGTARGMVWELKTTSVCSRFDLFCHFFLYLKPLLYQM